MPSKSVCLTSIQNGFLMLEPSRLPGFLGSQCFSSCMPRPDDSGSPPQPHQFGCLILLSGASKPSAANNYHFEAVPALQGARLPYGLQDSLPTLNMFCSLRKKTQLRHTPKARYGWVVNPYDRRSLLYRPTRTFTLQVNTELRPAR